MRLFLSVCLLLCLSIAQAQVCKPALSLYFSSNSAQLDKLNQDKLQHFLDSLGTSGEYKIEILGYTDSIGSEQANHALSDRRAKSVQQVIIQRKILYRSLKSIPRGEWSTRYANDTEERRALNRRVDLVLFPVKDEKITIKGDRGVEVEVDVRYFEPCPICETNPRLVEILDARAASDANIALISIDGQEMITGGMFKLEFDCPGRDSSACFTATARIPNAAPDSNMTVWESIETPEGVRWTNTGKRCTPDMEYYVMTLPCFKGTTSRTGMCNCDVIKCKFKVLAPDLIRSTSNVPSRNISDTVNTFEFMYRCPDSITVSDFGYDRFGMAYTLNKTLSVKGQQQLSLELASYERTLFFSDTLHWIKVSKKYTAPDIYIIPADSSLAMQRMGKKNVYQFKKPLHTFQLRMTKAGNSAERKELSLDQLLLRYNKKKKIVKVKIPSRLLKAKK